MTQSLLAFDTDRIKDYVFATSRLSEIRGASALLDTLNREAMLAEVHRIDRQATKVYAHGGSGLFQILADNSEAIIKAVQARYRRATGTASVTGVSVELPDDFDEDSDIRPYWRRLGLRLRAAKDRNTERGIAVTHPFLRPCDSCGVRYATETYAEPGGGQSVLCKNCRVKRREDRQIKDEIPQVVSGTLEPLRSRLWHRLVDELRQAGYAFAPLGAPYRPEDFNTLGRQSSPNNYFGLIYADGDDMGRKLERIETLAEMRRFTKSVDEAVYGAVKQAVLHHLQPGPNPQSLPFDVLLLGGDDLVMVTTAQAAVETALTIVEEFPRLVEQHWGKRLSLSAAVVLAHVNFPFGSLVNLAESALKFAKETRAERETEDGLLNFLVVSSANHLDFKDYHKATLKVKYNDETLYRTLRPYTAADMKQVIRAIRNLSDAPRGKLERLRAAVFQTRQQAMLEGLVTLLRWRDDEQRKTVHELVNAFADEQPSLFPWVQRNGEYHTPILDLVELFDFIP